MKLLMILALLSSNNALAAAECAIEKLKGEYQVSEVKCQSRKDGEFKPSFYPVTYTIGILNEGKVGVVTEGTSGTMMRSVYKGWSRSFANNPAQKGQPKCEYDYCQGSSMCRSVFGIKQTGPNQFTAYRQWDFIATHLSDEVHDTCEYKLKKVN